MENTSILPVSDGTGRVLGVRSTGEGPPVLLVNGYSGTSNDWDPTFLATLGSSRTVVAPDHQGIGASTTGELSTVTMASMADDLVVVLDGLGFDEVPVVGWSMGGMVAQSLAVRYPGRVSALALLGTDAGGPDACMADPEVWERLIDHSGSPRQQATRMLSLLFPDEVAVEIDRQFGEFVAGARAALSTDALRAQERAIDAWHATVPDPLPTPGPPVLVATGADDVVIPAANADLLAKRWGATMIERFNGCGHAFMAQEPVRLGELITRFLDSPI
jgi:pimeloyl-ACP methyl ester carboxylesterase